MGLDRRLRDELHQQADQVETDSVQALQSVTRRAGSRSHASGGLLAAAVAIVVLVFVAVILPARRPDASVPDGVDQTGSPGSTKFAASIVGSWTVTLTDSDPGVTDARMAGEWTMRLVPGSTISLTPPTGFVAPSRRAPDGYVHAEDGDSFLTTLFSRDYAASCTGPGSYTWTVDKDRLSFTTVGDTCDARRMLLTTRTWSPLASSHPN